MIVRQGAWIAGLTAIFTAIADAAANVWLKPWMESLTIEGATNSFTGAFATVMRWVTFPILEISVLNLMIAAPLFLVLRHVLKKPTRGRSTLTRERVREIAKQASKSDTHVINRPDGQSSVLHSVPQDSMSNDERLLMRVLALIDGGPLPQEFFVEIFDNTIAARVALTALVERGMISWDGHSARLGPVGLNWAHRQLQTGLGSENVITVVDRGARVNNEARL